MKKLSLILILIVSYNILSAQSYITNLPNKVQNIFIYDTLKINSLNNYSSTKNNKAQAAAMQFGQTIKLDEKDLSKGKWIYLGNDKYVWKILIEKENTSVLNAYFSNVNIKGNDKLYVYSLNKGNKTILVNSKNQTPRFGTSLFYCNSIVILFESSEIKELPFTLTEIGFSFENNNSNRDFGQAGDCEISINCVEGEDFNLQKNSVSRILLKQGDGLYWCTGSLINNTKKDGTPYLITANHCGESATIEDYSDWVFDFNFESPDCDRPVFEPEKKTIYGSQLLAHTPNNVNSYSDFKLLLLNEDIPSDFKPFYIGWDRRTAESSKGVSIHHPQGDIKMISSYLQPLNSTEYHNNIENSNGKYWRVNWSETESGQGVTEGGSSGAPIYNQQGLLIGTLTGGDASCTYPDDPDWFGKFSYHWDSNGDDSTTQLKYWLDPINTGQELLNGTNLDSSTLIAEFNSNSRDVTIGGSVQFNNLSQGNISEYNWFFEGGDPETSNQANPEMIKYYNAGNFDVKLNVKSANGADSLIATNYITVSSLIYPNITNGIVNIGVGSTPSEKIIVTVFNTNGQKVIEVENPPKSSEELLSIDLSSFTSGGYVIALNLDGFVQNYTIVLAK